MNLAIIVVSHLKFKILNTSYFKLKVCMHIEIAKLYLDLNFGGEYINLTALISCKNK